MWNRGTYILQKNEKISKENFHNDRYFFCDYCFQDSSGDNFILYWEK